MQIGISFKRVSEQSKAHETEGVRVWKQEIA